MSRNDQRNDSVLGRLLQEVSWEGRTVRRYRDGGSGYENVLMAEVMGALETLPRRQFLGRVLAAATGADDARAAIIDEIEEAEVLFLGEHRLGSIEVQPDVELATPSVLGWIEAKSLRAGASFGANQLPRQVASLVSEAQGRRPLLVTLTSAPPPIRVRGNGRLHLGEAVQLGLDAALQLRDGHMDPVEVASRSDVLVEQLPRILAWVTWEQLGAAVGAGLSELSELPTSVRASVQRQVDRIAAALDVHS